MGKKKEYYLIIDTETANTIEEPLCYDVGYCIADRTGKIYLQRAFVVAEIFLDMPDLMKSAYYAEKIPLYWDMIKSKEKTLKSFFNIRKIIQEDMKKYNIKKVCAYNAHFDRTALNNTLRYLSKSRFRWFFPWKTEYLCIWHMACQVLLNRSTYRKFAMQNGLIKESGNLQTSAEACYKYITDKVEFTESHMGLEDVLIETEILSKCFRTHKKMDTSINRLCWRIPQVATTK